MKSFDNRGNLVGEINTNTMYNNGQIVAQNVWVRDSQGHIEV